MITVHSYFKPKEWNDDKGKHSRIVMVATEFFATPKKDTVDTAISSICFKFIIQIFNGLSNLI